jgi:hypothetical protein
MFVTSYLPLREAIAWGVADEHARSVADEWATSFEHSYLDSFDRLRQRGPRPSMLLDVPELCGRIARLHGARQTQILVVDGMRFDLGNRTNERLRASVGPTAQLTERILLWAALPSTTAVQLDLLARGAAALKDTPGESLQLQSARGSNASCVRRVQLGNGRDVMKLDCVESSLCQPGARWTERMEHLANLTAAAIADYFAKLSPRTLVMVLGDHGFRVDDTPEGSSAARHGGASPEEVLVPAFAWLLGEQH